ncbi:hypothetical protein TSAR_008992, partial [Trichomalopsis sarcophagae]
EREREREREREPCESPRHLTYCSCSFVERVLLFLSLALLLQPFALSLVFSRRFICLFSTMLFYLLELGVAARISGPSALGISSRAIAVLLDLLL